MGILNTLALPFTSLGQCLKTHPEHIPSSKKAATPRQKHWLQAGMLATPAYYLHILAGFFALKFALWWPLLVVNTLLFCYNVACHVALWKQGIGMLKEIPVKRNDKENKFERIFCKVQLGISILYTLGFLVTTASMGLSILTALHYCMLPTMLSNIMLMATPMAYGICIIAQLDFGFLHFVEQYSQATLNTQTPPTYQKPILTNDSKIKPQTILGSRKNVRTVSYMRADSQPVRVTDAKKKEPKPFQGEGHNLQ